MRIHVGSTNEVKVGAVREVSAEYPCIAGAEIVGVEAASGVADQPKTLDETIRGAINRAKAAFEADPGSGPGAGGRMPPARPETPRQSR